VYTARVANYHCSNVHGKLSLSDLSQWQLQSCALSYIVLRANNQQQGGASLTAARFLHLGDRMCSARALAQGYQYSIDRTVTNIWITNFESIFDVKRLLDSKHL
jgi:hypothetical protein